MVRRPMSLCLNYLPSRIDKFTYLLRFLYNHINYANLLML